MHDALAYHSGGNYSDNAIGTIFSDEINRVPNVFFRERFSCRYIRLVKRDFDRFARLISAPAKDLGVWRPTKICGMPDITLWL